MVKSNIYIPEFSIPKGWEVLQLDKVGKFSKGKGILKDQLLPTGLPCIRYGEIYTSHEYIIKNFYSFISEETAKESQPIKKNVILFAGSGETLEDIGKAIAYIGEEVAYAGGDVIILSVNEKADPVYLSYMLNSDFVNWQKRRFGQGHSVVHIYPSDLATLKIPIAPLLEQFKIAAILSNCDKAIEAIENLIKRKERHKKALMQQLLTGKKRFKEFKGEKWKKFIIKDIGKVVSGGTPDTNIKEYFDGKILWCTPTEITKLKGEKYIRETERKITDLGLKNSSANILPPNSLIVCTRATIGYCAINSVEMSTNQGFKSIIPNKIIYIEFLYYLFLTMKNILLRLANGSTFLEVSKTDFENISLNMPVSIKEQEKIASVLSRADEEIQALNTQLEHLKQQKKGLMQVLLTGKVRVKTVK